MISQLPGIEYHCSSRLSKHLTKHKTQCSCIQWCAIVRNSASHFVYISATIMKYLWHFVCALSTLCLPLSLWCTGAIQKLVYVGTHLSDAELFPFAFLHFVAMQDIYCDWLWDSDLFPYAFYTLLLYKSSAVIGWSDPLGEVDMSHIALLPCRKTIWLISTSSYLGYKANQEILEIRS